MHQGRRVRQRVGEVALVAAEGHGAQHRSPLPATVAENDDEYRRLAPGGMARAHPLPLLGGIAVDLERRMAQLRESHLLHPEDEIVVDVHIGVDQLTLHRIVAHDDELPRLGIRARHRPAASLENPVDIGVGNGVRS
jgi:hypothetical protein